MRPRDVRSDLVSTNDVVRGSGNFEDARSHARDKIAVDGVVRSVVVIDADRPAEPGGPGGVGTNEVALNCGVGTYCEYRGPEAAHDHVARARRRAADHVAAHVGGDDHIT